MVYPRTFEEPGSLDIYIKVMGLWTERYRKSPSKLDRRPLNDKERNAVKAIRRRIESQLAQKPEEARRAAESMLRQAIDLMGDRAFLDTIVAQPQVMGVTLGWLGLTALVSIVALLVVRNVFVLFIVAPLMHAVGYVYNRPRRERRREAAMDKLLAMDAGTQAAEL